MDKKEFNLLATELKQVVMCLHRSAGNLDRIVMGMESFAADAGSEDSDEYLAALAKGQRRFRQDFLAAFGDIARKEKETWEKHIG